MRIDPMQDCTCLPVSTCEVHPDDRSEGAAPRAEGLPQPGIDMTPEQTIDWWERAAYSEGARAERAEDEVQRCRAERDAIAADEQAAVDELLAAPRAEGPTTASTDDVLRSFVTWGSEWLQEKERRENYRITPGMIPPPSFAERPAELNGQLAALVEEGVTALRAAPRAEGPELMPDEWPRTDPAAPRAEGLDVDELAAVLDDHYRIEVTGDYGTHRGWECECGEWDNRTSTLRWSEHVATSLSRPSDNPIHHKGHDKGRSHPECLACRPSDERVGEPE